MVSVSVEAQLKDLGHRIERYRLNRNITQAQLAREAGVSKRTVIRVEQGHSVQMANFLRIIAVLGLAEQLELMIPEPLISPIQQLALQGKQRQRASSPKSHENEQQEWRWDDDV